MRPLSNELYTVPKAEILFRPVGSAAFQNLGDADDVSLEVSVEESERYANNMGIRTLVKKNVTQTGATLSMTLAQMSAFARAASLMSTAETMSQQASSGVSETIDMVAGGIYKLAAMKISGVSIEGAIEGVDFEVDADAGFIESITVAGSTTVTYDAAAISSGHKSGIAGNASLRGEVIVRGVNAEGPKAFVRLWDVEIRPAGTRALISETEIGTIALTGSAYPASGKAPGYALGEEQTL